MTGSRAKHFPGARSTRSQFVRFILAGGTSACANILARRLLGTVVTYELSITLAYIVGLTVAFILMRILVFDGTAANAGPQYLRFAMVNVISFAQVWLISVALAHNVFPRIGFTWQSETVAHTIGVASLTFTSYFAHRHFSFRKPG